MDSRVVARVEVHYVTPEQMAAMEAAEHGEARTLRAECNGCGHRYKPRNPSVAMNRCPGCGCRGTIRFDKYIAEAEQPGEVVAEVKATAAPGAGHGSRRGRIPKQSPGRIPRHRLNH
jgi:hypothetical protein